MTKASRKADGVRDRITGAGGISLDETIYAGAGAGTGKTQALVGENRKSHHSWRGSARKNCGGHVHCRCGFRAYATGS
ncbi:MAG: hypothetical protein CM1200mP39_23770 [Dehalococcoidia bacterium]|nr:MAG: hypothetical protein CM1200mP39_23770 [Dehalococcoidia bacterium]